MVQTRAKRSATNQPVDFGRAARLTRAADNNNNNNTTIRGKEKGKQIAAPTGISDDDEEEDDDDDDEEEEDEEMADAGDAIVTRNHEIPRRGARTSVKTISPPPESEGGSQVGTRRTSTQFTNLTNPYTRSSSVLRPDGSSAPRSRRDQLHYSFESDYGDENEHEAVDAQEMAAMREDALDPLWSTTQGLAKILFNTNKEVRFKNPLLRIQCDNWANIINTIYTNQHDEPFFIDLPGVLATLSETSHEKARAVISASNATSLQNELINPHRIHHLSFFERLSADFPVPFVSEDAINDAIINLAIEIRTQTLILLLQNSGSDNQEAARIAAALFCAADPSVDSEDALKYGPYQPVCGGVESPLVARRATDILGLIEAKNVADAVTALRNKYPFDELSAKLTQWAYGIVKRAEETLREVQSESPMRRTPSPTASNISLEAADIHRLANTNETHLTRETALHLIQLSLQHPYQTRHQQATAKPREEDEEEETEREIIRATHTQARSSPAQNNANLSSPDISPVNGTKRPAQSQDMDEPFEEDIRIPDPERRAQLDRDRRNMPPPAQRPQKRQRQPLPPGYLPEPGQPSSSRPPASSNPLNGRSQLPPATDPRDVDFDVIRRQNRLPSPRIHGASQRQFWSDADTHRLIRLINLHHCRWAIIARRQEEGRGNSRPSLEMEEDLIFDVKRDQQAIRDKARNIKVDLLKADLNLFPGFDNVALGKKERDILINRGKNPDRREADVDGEGFPTNTRYIPM